MCSFSMYLALVFFTFLLMNIFILYSDISESIRRLSYLSYVILRQVKVRLSFPGLTVTTVRTSPRSHSRFEWLVPVLINCVTFNPTCFCGKCDIGVRIFQVLPWQRTERVSDHVRVLDGLRVPSLLHLAHHRVDMARAEVPGIRVGHFLNFWYIQ